MCGVLFVKSQQPLGLDLHLAAMAQIKPRGPDFINYQHQGNIFIAHSVLQITGRDDFYHAPRSDFVAYNGEIYNYRWFGNYGTDTELVYRTAKNRNYKKFAYFEGPWAWVYTDFESVTYATDPQGERCLYRYQDSDILIVSSEVSAILTYIQTTVDLGSHSQKHWPVFARTPYQGIDRCEPGRLYTEAGATVEIDSVFNWSGDEMSITDQEAQLEFDQLFDSVIAQMRPNEPVGVTVSGGIDSSIILAAMPHTQGFYTTVCEGKETVSVRAREFLSPTQASGHTVLAISAAQWAEAYIDILKTTAMPVQSWSFVGQWIIAKNCAERVLFTGVAADELFGGYSAYQHMTFDTKQSVSPYSRFDHDPDCETLWRRCVTASQGHPGRATLLMDYITQVSAVDARGVDAMTQAHGVEPRSPFMHPKIIKFALNLPWRLRQGKPLLRERFLRTYSPDLLLPKQGFAGHCNDSLPWLDIAVPPGSDRHQQWKDIQRISFVKYCGTGSSQWPDQTMADQ